MMKFYDTCALLNLQEDAFLEPFAISSITLLEIEDIKTSRNKDEDIKWKARNMSRLLTENPDMYTVKVIYNEQAIDLHEYLMPNSPDGLIAFSAYLFNVTTPIIFVSDDLNCRHIAKHIFKLNTEGSSRKTDNDYLGYRELTLSDEGLTMLYANNGLFTKDMYINEYMIVRNESGDVVDLLKWNGKNFTNVIAPKIKSNEFGNVKPYNGDVYQKLLLDSFDNHQITMARGAAGTGKTYLALAYLFSLLEKGKIDRIVVFCNTIPTLHSARIGFLPGTRDEKLLESSTGNMLSSKLGDPYRVQQLINENKLVLLPMCDIRGYDTTNMNAGILISEAQNADIELLKLSLQRIGADCKCIVDGDYHAQVDDMNFAGANNGMRRMSEVFRGQDLYGEVCLQNIYRSRIAEIAEMM